MDFSHFHFLRPWAFWLLLLLPALLWLPRLPGLRGGSWQQVVDARLLPFLLQGQSSATRQRSAGWMLLWLVAVLALAGPSWSWQEVPVMQNLQARVLVLDLSASMNATDIAPSRLQRARFKITDLLKSRKEGQHALVVFAGDAFVVTPLSDDWRTIQSLLPALTTDLMPVQGSRIDRGLEKALDVLQQAGAAEGEVIVLSDSPADERALKAARQLKRAGHRVSVLAIGTETGAPVPGPRGGFLQDRQGQIVISKLDPDSLEALAQAGGGRMVRLSADDSDIRQLEPDKLPEKDQLQALEGRQSRIWEDRGWWLLPLVILLFLPLFRRGWLFSLALLPLLQPAPAQALDWQDLWLRPDQQAWRQLQQQQAEQAAALAQDPALKGEALFRAGQPEAAAEQWQQWAEQAQTPEQQAEAWYDRGNALAHAGKIQQAIEAYQQAEQLNPQLADASHNRKVLEDFLQQQQQQNQNQQNQQNQQQQDQQNEQNAQQEPAQSQNTDSGEQSEQENRQPQQQEPSEQEEAQAQQEPAQSEDAEDRPPEGQLQQTQPQDPLTEEERQALEQWLRQVPDDPGGLLRRKFLYQYSQRKQQQQEEQPW